MSPFYFCLFILLVNQKETLQLGELKMYFFFHNVHLLVVILQCK